MLRNLSILAAAAIVVALPFLLRPAPQATDWKPGAPQLVIITPHNEAIRHEFAEAFSAWHAQRFGQPVKIDWRAIGGTSEIARYLAAEFTSAFRGWWTGQRRAWPAGAADAMLDRRFNTKAPPEVKPVEGETDAARAEREREVRQRWEILRDLHLGFRGVDDSAAFSAQIDLFFGGGEYDHAKAFGEGLTVPPWPEDAPPEGLFVDAQGREMIPARIGGETWRSATLFGVAVSTFGICYNIDRLRDLAFDPPPSRWDDLADPRLFRQVGVADPTKSGSIAKAFELIIHQKCAEAVAAAGYTKDDIDRFEAAIAAAKLPIGEVPDGVPVEYQAAVEQGWLDGVKLVRLIGANARYFTDSAGKVPIDVGSGNAAAGLAIDFYGRFQAQSVRGPDGRERMVYVTPIGGSGASCDPISLLRGAPNREIAVRFIEFVLRDEGQRLWTYRPGTPGGPKKYTLRRVPLRRSFFPSDDADLQASHEEHLRHAADDLADPQVNPYSLAANFTYRPRWTGAHFGIHRDLIRAMCLDSSKELQAAWKQIISTGGPAANPEAMTALERLPDLPEPITWRDITSIAKRFDRLTYMREWTAFFRATYKEAAARAKGAAP